MYFFICSAARSGSTLLDIILGGHKDAASLGEFSFFNKAIALDQQCSCGKRVVNCPNWAPIINEVNKRYGFDLKSEPYNFLQWDAKAIVTVDIKYQTKIYLLKKLFRTHYCDIKYSFDKDSLFDLPLPNFYSNGVNNSITLYDLILKNWGKQYIIDSSKNIHKAVSIYERVPEKVKIIYLVRDGRGVFNSRISSGFSQYESYRGWKKYNLRTSRILNSRMPPNSFYQIKYEDLVSDTEYFIKDICSFLEIDFQPEMLEISKGERHLVDGNITMYNRAKGIKADTKWMTELKPADEKYFYEKCGVLNEEFGYKPRELGLNTK